MSTVQEFYRNCREVARLAVHSGTLIGFSLDDNWILWPSPNSFGDDPVGPVQILQVEDAFGALIRTVDPNAKHVALQPGSKVFQLRVWPITEFAIDSNLSSLIMGVEVEVHRMLAFPDEDEFYVADEMMENQMALLDRSSWLAEDSIRNFVDGEEPTIESVEREDQTLRYTMTFQAVLQP